MKIRIEGSYNEVFEREYDFESEGQLAVIADYLFQYKQDLHKRWMTELNPIKKEAMMAKVVHVEELLENHKELFTFLHESHTAL